MKTNAIRRCFILVYLHMHRVGVFRSKTKKICLYKVGENINVFIASEGMSNGFNSIPLICIEWDTSGA